MVEDRRLASEAKGPFPGGKRVGSRGKEKNVKKQKPMDALHGSFISCGFQIAGYKSLVFNSGQ